MEAPREPGSQRKRRRPAVSCTLCRRRKIRCNRETPCSNCLRSKNDACVYDLVPPGHVGNPDTYPHASSEQRGTQVESMMIRIRQLEEQLKSNQSAPSSQATTSPAAALPALESHVTPNCRVASSSEMGGTFHVHLGNPAYGQRPDNNRSITHKRRMFGQSHWVTSSIVLLQDIIGLLSTLGEEDRTEIGTLLHRCKHMARLIKSQRTPPWPCSPTPELPPKNIADELLDCYLHTTESVYRILHIPSFMEQYETIWTGTPNSDADKTFFVLVKLIFAIGAASYNGKFTLRTSAIRWVYEAEAWLANPTLKHRLGLQYFQIYCLLLLAREACAVGEDLVWISTGGLFRAAMHMGLHRDPDQLAPRTTFANEMHRRLWNTIIELCLQASLNHGGPPLISLEDFDTQPPGNFDDKQLTESDAIPKPDRDYTATSVAIALRHTFAARLTITRFLNCIGTSGSYEETLLLDAEFRLAYKALRNTLQGFRSNSHLSASEVELRMVEVIMHRYLIGIHMPFFTSSMQDAAHAYSRKVALDSSLKIWYAINPPTVMAVPGPFPKDGLRCMATCGSGFLHMAVMQAVLVVEIELREQLKEDDGFGSVPLRRDLVAIVEHATEWLLQTLEAGETNIKGYLFAVLMSANIEGLMKGLKETDIAELMGKKVRESEERALGILQNLLPQPQLPQQNIEDLGQMSLDVDPGAFEGWGFLMQDFGFDASKVDPMSWIYDQGNTQAAFIF